MESSSAAAVTIAAAAGKAAEFDYSGGGDRTLCRGDSGKDEDE